MSTTNVPVPYSFVKFNTPGDYGDCERPLVNLPMVNPSDLSFQIILNAPVGYLFAQKIFNTYEAIGSVTGNILTISSVIFGVLQSNMPLFAGWLPAGTIVGEYVSGNPTGACVFKISTNAPTPGGGAVFNYYPAIDGLLNVNKILGTLGARVCVDCDANAPVFNPITANLDMQWVATACSPIANTVNGGNQHFVFYFQYTGMNTEWAALQLGQCFNICLYEIECVNATGTHGLPPAFGTMPGIWPYVCLGAVLPQLECSYTVFNKIEDECENYPTSLLQYSNVNDAFGFFYNYLGQLANNINYVNSVRLPMYLHSPEQIEEQESYSRSDGSTLKLSHRIWTDYKFKANQLDKFNIKALTIATAHDFVFITCHIEGIDYDASQGVYQQGNPAQFLRLEKVEIKWFQEEAAFLKLGWATGKFRLALAEQYVNSNCD